MTVAELIEELKKMDQGAPALTWDHERKCYNKVCAVRFIRLCRFDFVELFSRD